MTNSPAISVIIPMYNAEKYIGECLESILAQTFQDFEVIVVDDCSTDSSLKIVESYASKFNGRLKLFTLEKNSGNGVMPRNKGLLLAHGEYVFFMDNDDLIALTALEELYMLARDFDTDVVYCERVYMADEALGKISFISEQQTDFVDKPTFESDFPARVSEILSGKFLLTPWGKLVKRNLLIDNEIFFPPVKIADDDIWLYCLLFYAKKFLRVPNVVYVWRQVKQSVLHREKSPQETINFWLSPVIDGLKFLDNMLDKIEFFRQNPQYRCAIIEHLVHSKAAQLFDASLKMSPSEIYETIKQTFGKSLGMHDVLISWLLTDLISQQKIFVANQNRIDELEKQVRK